MCWKISTAQKAFLMEYLDYFKKYSGDGAAFFLCIYETFKIQFVTLLQKIQTYVICLKKKCFNHQAVDGVEI